ncbi:MAG: hypothetical protein ABMB14_37440, partial [Myxococcota bacterium]
MTDPAVQALHVRLDPTSMSGGGPDSIGGWQVLAGAPGQQFVSGIVSPDAVRAAFAAAAELDRPTPGILVPGRDSERSRLEERVGRALSVAVAATSDLARGFGQALGAARASGVPLLVAIDTSDAAIRALPWELLADSAESGSLEPRGDAVVALLGAGRRSPIDPRPAVRFWSPDDGDATIDHLRSSVVASAGRHGVPLDQPDGVLVIAGHGARVDASLGIRSPEGDWSPSTCNHHLLPFLGTSELVVLAVCDASDRSGADDWPLRVLAAGAGAVVGPTGPVRD